MWACVVFQNCVGFKLMWASVGLHTGVGLQNDVGLQTGVVLQNFVDL
jgi:hypothetical protein